METKVRCIIVDDEPLAIKVVKGHCDQVSQIELIATCANALEAFQVLNKEKIDLMFIDIEMPDLTGLEFIKSLANPPSVILTTAYREYAIESYEIDVVDYLLKPISFSRFFKAFGKYLKLNKGEVDTSLLPQHSKNDGSIFVYSNKKNVKVNFDDILYIESLKDYIRIHTTSESIVSKDTITRYEHLLPDAFMRIHRSFIVSLSKITAFTHQDIEIGRKEIPIGTRYKKVVIDRLKNH